jgi:hypothetical protein
MDKISQEIFEDILNEIKCKHLHQTANSLEDKITRLRESFKNNRAQIRNIESKILDNNFKEQFPIQYGRFEAQLEILKERENEIKEEGIRLKVENDCVRKEIQQIKTSYLTTDINSEAESQAIENENSFKCSVGSKWLRVAEFLFSSKTCNEIFYPIVGDWREDYLIALRKGRIFDAIFISVKNYFIFAYTIVICSKLGRLIEFILKIADVIEFFNKFSK